jgi:hypothetical protein
MSGCTMTNPMLQGAPCGHHPHMYVRAGRQTLYAGAAPLLHFPYHAA